MWPVAVVLIVSRGRAVILPSRASAESEKPVQALASEAPVSAQKVRRVSLADTGMTDCIRISNLRHRFSKRSGVLI